MRIWMRDPGIFLTLDPGPGMEKIRIRDNDTAFYDMLYVEGTASWDQSEFNRRKKLKMRSFGSGGGGGDNPKKKLQNSLSVIV